MGLLFESSWNTATGTSDAAINDGGKWSYEEDAVENWPSVVAGGPGGNNFLKMVTNGAGGRGPNPAYTKWVTPGAAAFGDPDNLYFRVYYRMNQVYQ